MIAHHFSGWSLAIEIGIVVALLAVFGTIALRERRRRRTRSDRPAARMRNDG